MIRKLFIIVHCTACLLISVPVFASTYSILHDYGLNKDHATTSSSAYSENYFNVSDRESPRFSDNFALSGFSSINSMELKITHQANNYSSGWFPSEKWQAEINNHQINLGSLSNSLNSWVTDTFNFTAEQINSFIKGNGFNLHFSEQTWWNNNFNLDKIEIKIDGVKMSPTPIPPTLIIFGIGFVSLLGFRKRFFNKRT